MKYSFMSFSCPGLDFDALCETARRYGYDGIEPRVSSGHRHGLEFTADPSVRQRARETAERNGIAICCVATSCRFSDPATVAAAVEDAHRAIDLASDLGSPRLRVFGGPIADGLSRGDAVAQVVRAMRSLQDHAGEAGVTLCLETHDSWCDPADLAQVVSAVNHPAVRITWDIMHPVYTAGKTMDQAFEQLHPWIDHVHCHDCVRAEGKMSLVPIGQGMIDHRRALRLLRDNHYEGFISGEWIKWQPADIHLPRELATLRRFDAKGST